MRKLDRDGYPIVLEGYETAEPERGGGSQRLAVVGDPIEHSRSPQLHVAGFRALGLRWEYSRWQIRAGGLADALSARGEGWRGLSVTAPLKAEALEFAAEVSEDARRTGAVNTLTFDQLAPGTPARGENTDVPGILAALAEHGASQLDGIVQILGSGQTAASAALAALRAGSGSVEVYARRPEQAEQVAARLGSNVSGHDLADWRPHGEVALVVDTVPGGLPQPDELDVPEGILLLSAAYDPWPTPLATAWPGAADRVITGLDMLAHQARFQLRLFTGRHIDEEIPNEAEVFARMRETLT